MCCCNRVRLFRKNNIGLTTIMNEIQQKGARLEVINNDINDENLY